MKRWMTLSIVWLACLGVVLPETAFAEVGAPSVPSAPAAPTAAAAPVPAILDVELRDGGILAGQVLDRQGVPVPATLVVLRQNDNEVASTMTDANGQFHVSGLRGGVYQVESAQGAGLYRLWAAHTAPPTAQTAALVVSGNVVRGQCCGQCCGGCDQGCGILGWLTDPWVVAGLIAAAIAIPIAVTSNHRSSS